MAPKEEPKTQASILGYDIEVPEPKRQASIVPKHVREQIKPEERRKQPSIAPDFGD